MKRLTIIILLAAAAGMVSCSAVRHCKAPDVDLPERIAGEDSDSLTVADVQWWRFYGDSTLCQIIERTLDNNRDMLAAAAVASVTAAVAVFGLGAGYVYDDRHTLEIGAVQGVDGALTLALVGHLDKAETARTSGLPVCDDVSRRYLSVLCEKCLQTLACRAEVQF